MEMVLADRFILAVTMMFCIILRRMDLIFDGDPARGFIGIRGGDDDFLFIPAVSFLIHLR